MIIYSKNISKMLKYDVCLQYAIEYTFYIYMCIKRKYFFYYRSPANQKIIKLFVFYLNRDKRIKRNELNKFAWQHLCQVLQALLGRICQPVEQIVQPQ